jgi:peptidoglycan/LPS O-acetylase OafA/YrhL
MLAMLHTELGPRATPALPRPVPALLILVGLFVCSYPTTNPEWAAWSRVMTYIGAKVTPEKTDLSYYWVSVGASTLMIGIFLSRDARRVLSLPFFNFLGRVSLPVYVLHNTLLRSVLVWMVYSNAATSEDPGTLKPAGTLTFMVAIPFFLAMVYAAAYLWLLYVDPWCGKMIQWMVTLMFIREQHPDREKTALLTLVA